MQAVRGVAGLGWALALGSVLVLTAAGASYAYDDTGTPPPKTSNSGTSDSKGNLDARAGGVSITYPGRSTGGSTKPLTSVDANWSPPPCWFGPKYTPAQFKAEYTANFNKELPDVHGTFRSAMGMDMAHYKDGLDYPGGDKGYKDFNSAQAGKGMWWDVTVNPDASVIDQMDCNDQGVEWVPNGQLPPTGTLHVITPEMLSKLAYAHTQVQGVTIDTNPTGTQTVNLSTWVTLEEKYTTVKVRASVDLGGGREIWAETSAQPQSVHIDAGTPEATVFPASGDCAIKADGTVGAAYSGDAAADPPCGVTYRHSTAGQDPYQLNVTVNWKVSWTGSGGGPFALPDGRVDDPHPVTVREIQTIN
jgi:enoyl reductase